MLYAYMRVSTPHQTLENQHYALLKFADQRGFRIDAWITESSSGAKAYTERALGQLLEQLRPQDTLLVAEISRLGRRLLDILQIVHRLMDTPVTLISVKEGLEVGNTLNGYLFRGVVQSGDPRRQAISVFLKRFRLTFPLCDHCQDSCGP